MKKAKEIKLNGNGNHAKNGKTKEFDFGDSETAKSLIKALTTTRKRLYPERYDEKGNLKAEWIK